MPFVIEARQTLRRCRYVTPTVVARLAWRGYFSRVQWAKARAQNIMPGDTRWIGAGRWKNRPQAKVAMAAVLDVARQHD